MKGEFIGKMFKSNCYQSLMA